jgi:hypothetical protein
VIEFAEHHLLIALAAMVVIQFLTVVNGRKYGGVIAGFVVGSLIGLFVFWILIIMLPQVI